MTRRKLILAEEFLKEGGYEWGLEAQLGHWLRGLGRGNAREWAALKGPSRSFQTTPPVLLCEAGVARGRGAGHKLCQGRSRQDGRRFRVQWELGCTH